MRIMTPDEVREESALLVEETVKQVNRSLVKGRRTFFSGTSKDESYIPPGYISQVKSSLEKSGWVVEVRGGPLPNGFIEVYTPKEKAAK